MKWILPLAFTVAACSPVALGASRSATPIASPLPSPSVAPAPTATPTPSVTSLPTTTSARPTRVRFVDRDHGWLGLEDGILATADGGTTWSRQLTSPSIERIWSFDAKHAWAQSGTTLYRTRDGLAWERLAARDAPFSEMQFVNEKLGWAIANDPTQTPVGRPVQAGGTLFQTTDGGATWTAITTHSLRSACFVDERTGWGAYGKQIFKSVDGGRRWTQVADLAIADEGPWYPAIRCADSSVARVQITEPFAAMSHAPYLMYRTTDGGKRWTLEYGEQYTLGAIVPSDTPELGSYPSIFETLPDRDTWLVTCTPPMDKQTFLVLSVDGAVKRKADVPFASCVNDATFIDADNGWIVGPVFGPSQTMSVVIRTRDGGRSWERIYPRA